MPNRLYEIRKSKELTLKDVMIATGINESSLCSYEAERRGMDKQVMFKLADFYQVTLDYMMGRDMINNFDDTKFTRYVQKDELTQNLLDKFKKLSFDNKLKVFNFINELDK